MADNRSGVEGAEAVKAAMTAIGVGAERELRLLAHDVALRIRAGARQRVPVGSGITRDGIVVESAADAERVFVQIPAYRPQYLDIWLEFGTVKMPARPFLFPAARLEEPRFRSRAAEVLERVVENAVRGAR
jgi:hypothetical protein